MAGLLDMILSARGGSNVKDLANRFGLDESQTTSALGQIIPALAGGVKRNVAEEGGLESLLGALQKGDHERFLEQPEALADEAAEREGKGILGHLFGSKEVSREVASRAAEKSGVSSDVLKKMLPMAASMFMGSLAKGGKQGGLLSSLGGGSAPKVEKNVASGLLGKLLDKDGDGSIADDLLGMARKFF